MTYTLFICSTAFWCGVPLAFDLTDAQCITLLHKVESLAPSRHFICKEES